MHRFLIVIEKTDKNYSAYSPDLPGCVATGKTRDQVDAATCMKPSKCMCVGCWKIDCRYPCRARLPSMSPYLATSAG